MTESFVHYFIEAQGPNYDHEQLSFTIRDLVAAGMETTTTTILWAIVLLTNHSSVQERLHEEIESVVGSHRMPSLDDRSRSVNTVIHHGPLHGNFQILVLVLLFL